MPQITDNSALRSTYMRIYTTTAWMEVEHSFLLSWKERSAASVMAFSRTCLYRYTYIYIYIYITKQTHLWGRGKMDALWQKTFSNAFFFNDAYGCFMIDKFIKCLKISQHRIRWCQTSGKTLIEPMMALFANAYFRHLSLLSWWLESVSTEECSVYRVWEVKSSLDQIAYTFKT